MNELARQDQFDSMIQSLRDLEGAEEFFRDYGLIIVDECHHLPAFSFESTVKQAPVRYLLGLTATPYRRDGLQDIITMQCGPIRHTISTRHSGSLSEVALELMIRETRFAFPDTEDMSIQEVFSALVQDQDRTGRICDDILVALGDGRRCLVLSERREHCRAIADRLISHGKVPFLLDGGLRKRAREAIVDAIRSRARKDTSAPEAGEPSETDLLVIATGQYLGEGFDCPELDTLFLAFPVSFKGKLIQYVGRILRACGGKSRVRVYDYADVEVSVLKRMFAKRLRTYRNLGFVPGLEPGLDMANLWGVDDMHPKGK